MQNLRIFLIGEQESFTLKSLVAKWKRGRNPPNPPFDFSIDKQRTALPENTVFPIGNYTVDGCNVHKIRANKTIVLSKEKDTFTALEKAIKLN